MHKIEKRHLMTLDNFVFYLKRAGLKYITWKFKKNTCKSICHVNHDYNVYKCSDPICTAYSDLGIQNFNFEILCKERSKCEDWKYSSIYKQERH